MAELKEGVVGGAMNLYFIYKFLRILTTPFASTDAFKLGIIDEKGKILIKKSKLKSIEQKEAYTMFDRLVWKLKRLMEKIPFGKTRLASYAAALWLIKEENNFNGTDKELQESFLDFLETDWKNEALILKENYEGDMDKKTYRSLKEGIDIKKASMKDVIKDFQSSDAPQFKGKSDKKKKEMAIAAKLSKEDVELDERYYFNIGRGVYYMSPDSHKIDHKKEVKNGYPNALEVLSSTKQASDYVAKKNNIKEEVELDEMPNRANMEKINSLLKDYAGKFKWRDEVLYVEKGIEKDVANLIKKGGLTTTIKVSSNPMREDVELDEVLVMGKAPKQMKSADFFKMYKKLKSKQTIKIWFDSTLAKGTKWKEFKVGKISVLKNGVGKITLQQGDRPSGVKFFLYNRDGRVSLAMGDMGVSMTAMKEEIDEKKVPKLKFKLKQFKHLKSKKKKKEHGPYSRFSDTSGGFSFMKRSDKSSGYVGAYNEYVPEAAVLDVKDTDKWVSEIKKGIKAGWVSVGSSTLGGDKNVAILIKFTLEQEKDWPNKILQNARFGMIRIATDGTMEMFASDRRLKNMRKTKVKSAKDVVNKINTWIKKVDEEVVVEAKRSKEDELKYQAALAAFKKKGGKIKKDKPGPTFKSFFKGYKHKKGPRQAEELELTEVELDEGSSDTTDMYALMVKGMKAMPGSPKQKEIIKQINVIRKRIGMPLMKEGALEEWAFDEEKKDGFSFSKFITEGRPKQDKDFVPDATKKDHDRTGIWKKYADAQQKHYTPQEIESIARKYKQKVADVQGGKTWDWEWLITLMNGIRLDYDYGSNTTTIKKWKLDKKKLETYLSRYRNEHETIRDLKGDGGIQVIGLETAFELIEQVELNEEAPANSVAGGNVNLDPFTKKKRKNAKVQTEMFGGQKVFVVSPERFYDSRMGKARYARYEKYVGNDKLGEAIRQYGRNNPKNSIILKNSGNGAMLYLKYGRQ